MTNGMNCEEFINMLEAQYLESGFLANRTSCSANYPDFDRVRAFVGVEFGATKSDSFTMSEINRAYMEVRSLISLTINGMKDTSSLVVIEDDDEAEYVLQIGEEIEKSLPDGKSTSCTVCHNWRAVLVNDASPESHPLRLRLSEEKDAVIMAEIISLMIMATLHRVKSQWDVNRTKEKLLAEGKELPQLIEINRG